jgi:hypothetical protein
MSGAQMEWEEVDLPTGPAVLNGTYRGSLRQMCVMAATVRARSELEGVHSGIEVPPLARVRFRVRECPYDAVPRISPDWSADFVERMRSQIAFDLIRFTEIARLVEPDLFHEILTPLSMTARWDLPTTSRADIEDRMAIIRDDVLTRSGNARPPRPRTIKVIGREGFLSGFLKDFNQGDPEFVEAQGAGDDVLVETVEGWRPWQEASHLTKEDMERFSRGLSSEVYTTMIAVERVCGRVEFEQPLSIPLPLASLV